MSRRGLKRFAARARFAVLAAIVLAASCGPVGFDRKPVEDRLLGPWARVDEDGAVDWTYCYRERTTVLDMTVLPEGQERFGDAHFERDSEGGFWAATGGGHQMTLSRATIARGFNGLALKAWGQEYALAFTTFDDDGEVREAFTLAWRGNAHYENTYVRCPTRRV